MTERKIGLDIYRIILACMVVFIHMCNTSDGGAIQGLDGGTVSKITILTILTLSYSAVNGYALLSGYLGYGKIHNIKKALVVWLELLFYSVAITLVVGTINGGLSFIDIIKSFFPLSFGQWWYINIYCLLIVIMPLIDKSVENLSRESFIKITSILILTICISNAVLGRKDIFYIYDGYSFAWISILYFIGAGIKKFNIEKLFNKKIWLFIWISACIITISSKYWDNILALFHINYVDSVLYNYDSITVVISAISSLCLFALIETKNNNMFISKIAAGSFAAYIIHVHLFFEKYYFRDRFIEISKTIYCPSLILIDLLFVLLSSLIDILRQKLFAFVKTFMNRRKLSC